MRDLNLFPIPFRAFCFHIHMKLHAVLWSQHFTLFLSRSFHGISIDSESLKLKPLGYDKKTSFGCLFLLSSLYLSTYLKRSCYDESAICTTSYFSCCFCLFFCCFSFCSMLCSLSLTISRRFILVAFAKESHTRTHI